MSDFVAHASEYMLLLGISDLARFLSGVSVVCHFGEGACVGYAE